MILEVQLSLVVCHQDSLRQNTSFVGVNAVATILSFTLITHIAFIACNLERKILCQTRAEF